jgi:hypothetical protein
MRQAERVGRKASAATNTINCAEMSFREPVSLKRRAAESAKTLAREHQARC